MSQLAANLGFLLFSSYRIFRKIGAKYGSESLFLPILLFCPFKLLTKITLNNFSRSTKMVTES